MTEPGRLFVFGLGFSGSVLARRLRGLGWQVAGTTRDAGKRAALLAEGIETLPFDRDHPLPAGALAGVTHAVVSVPPDAEGDPVAALHGLDLAALPTLRWLGYLSTTGVYGDHQGGWVDETTPLTPDVSRSERRAGAEAAWLDLLRSHGLPVHIFRLAGIYGPGRSAIDMIRAGRARRIIKPGQVFCRIHVEDIATVLQASMARPDPGAIYNVADDEPAAPEVPIEEAARLLGVAPPPAIPFDEADLSPMAASFYRDSRRVRNDRIKTDLGIRLTYPTYREGLRQVLESSG
ncbi:SDR family oxidoreductase [Caenispirillum bisanense]|uniref:SDR family oxidoreductase n=1 Tax=Caenispirillum bisanense TaxID=414052 RepID=UPI0031D8CC22